MLADEVVPTAEMDEARPARRGRVDERRNDQHRRQSQGAPRQAQEPLDLFRRYMSNYAREQAHCLYSPALIDNLERNWNAKHR